MRSIRRLGQYCSIVSDNVSLEDVVKIAYQCFQIRQKKLGRNYDYLKLENTKYYRHFALLVARVLFIIYGAESSVKLGRKDLIRLFLQYFAAIYPENGRGVLYITQVASVYALELFQKWCIDEYGSLHRFVTLMFKESVIIDEEEGELSEDVEMEDAFINDGGISELIMEV